MSTFFWGAIDRNWAEGVAQSQIDIWRHNGRKTECIDREVTLAKLGGLVVAFDNEIYGDENDPCIPREYAHVDLAFGGLYRITNNWKLRRAALERSSSDPLVSELSKTYQEIGFDAVWKIPVSAITPAEGSDDMLVPLTTGDVLPKKQNSYGYL